MASIPPSRSEHALSPQVQAPVPADAEAYARYFERGPLCKRAEASPAALPEHLVSDPNPCGCAHPKRPIGR